MKFKYCLLSLTLIITACSSGDWCDHDLRSQFAELKAVTTTSDWYEVFEVGTGVYAIAEPYNYQEVISYLIIGNEKALLFDTGMGMGSISALAKELTDLPISVLNSHSHYDHIGGNHEFDTIYGMELEYTQNRAKSGVPHDQVNQEVTPEAFCNKHLPAFDTAQYSIKPYAITEIITNGSIIDLGGRVLEIVQVPGHTPDAIALLDEANGYLWTGDTFYEAPIWLFDQGTDLEDYRQSTEVLASLASKLIKVFPAHNTPVASPERLPELKTAFNAVINKEKAAQVNDEDEHTDSQALTFEFEHFSFVIRRDELKQYGYQ